MPTARPNTFAPPSAQQVRRHLERHAPRGPSALRLWGPLVLLMLIISLLLLGGNSGITVLFAWLILGLAMGLRALHRRWLLSLEDRTHRVHEFALRRHWRESLRLAWRALPTLVNLPELHGRVVALIAHDLDQLKAYDAAIAAYDFMIERLPAEHPAAFQFRVQRSLAELASDRLTDADQTLRRLRSVADPYRGSPSGALYRFAMLVQQIRTNHFDDAVADSSDLLDDLRPLGIEAGYGHALLALALSRVAAALPAPPPPMPTSAAAAPIPPDASPAIPPSSPVVDAVADATLPAPDPAADLRRQAGLWWSRATLLLPPAALVERFPELAPLASQFPAAQPPAQALAARGGRSA